MPNWCQNSIVIDGDKESLSRFIASITTDTELDFTRLVPRPADKEEDWYNWSYDNWGVKWSPSDIYVVDETETSASFSFLSAWGAPAELFATIAKLFPALDFILAYSESGMCFCGAIKWAKGELYNECHISDYTEDPRYEALVAEKKDDDERYSFYDEVCDLENTIRDECLTAVGG